MMDITFITAMTLTNATVHVYPWQWFRKRVKMLQCKLVEWNLWSLVSYTGIRLAWLQAYSPIVRWRWKKIRELYIPQREREEEKRYCGTDDVSTTMAWNGGRLGWGALARAFWAVCVAGAQVLSMLWTPGSLLQQPSAFSTTTTTTHTLNGFKIKPRMLAKATHKKLYVLEYI